MTERLELKPLTSQAAAALSENQDEAARILGATFPAGWPQPDLLGILALRPPSSPEAERFGVWVMIERDSRSVVGDIGFKGPPGDMGRIEIGYSVIPSRRRRGYAKEAARALIDWALSEPKVRVIVADCHPGNVPSIRTLERVGFHRTGETDGEIRWRYGSASGEV